MKSKKVTTLDDSSLDRKNVLNNPFAIEQVQKEVGIKGYEFEGAYRYTTDQILSFYEIDRRTLRRYIAEFSEELAASGYEVIKGERLARFKKQYVGDINVTNLSPQLGLFTFKAFLNIGMLLKESEKARILRGFILDIVIDVVSKKAGGNTKYINQRDEEFLISLYVGQNYKKEFIEALKTYVASGNIKYPIYTNKIYISIFKENASKYKKILSLSAKENVRDTLYAEVLTTILMYENGLARKIRDLSKQRKRKLTIMEVDALFKEFESDSTWEPLIESVRRKMSSRDYALRGIEHPELSEYVYPLGPEEFERFLGEKSKELAKQIEDHKEVFKRLKNK